MDISSKSMKLYQLIVSLCLWSLSHAELFTALEDLKKVLVAERSVAATLKEYVTKEEARLAKIYDNEIDAHNDKANLAIIKGIADDFAAHSAKALLDPDSHLADPVNAFLLVKRFTKDWDFVVNGLINKTSNSKELIADIHSKMSPIPDDEDLSGAANALFRLQDTYALPTNKIATGDLPGVKEPQAMTSEDCYQLGLMAYRQQDYYHTILWLSHALDMLDASAKKSKKKSEKNTKLQIPLIVYLAYATYMQGNTKKSLELTERWLKLDPNDARAKKNKQVLAEHLQSNKSADAVPEAIRNERQLDKLHSSSEFKAYEALCRGEDVVPNPDAHKLTCQYKRHHPMFYLAPLREETMYLDPLIVVYHQLMTDTEINLFKQMAQPRLKRARTVQTKGESAYATDKRISKSAWLEDVDLPEIASVTRKSAAAVNLSTDTAEDLLVANYGIGGQFEPHNDFTPRDEDEAASYEAGIDNRIATVIYYMTDVAAGGATVFPSIGVKLLPEKGSAAAWFNLKRSGAGDMKTRHAGCPVLTGNKWVGLKWFRERGNEFNRPCDVNPAL